MVRVKICGITDQASAWAAVEAGADAIGFVFTMSKREIAPDAAKAIIQSLPPYVTTVGVFVDEPLHRLNDLANYCRLDLIQLHGDESPVYCEHVDRPVVKTIKVKEASDLQLISAYKHVTRALLLDAYVAGEAGGTGHKLPWHLAVRAHEQGTIILAGGLDARNVEEAILATRPFAVDVSSGVETDGRKDQHKMLAFVQQARAASRHLAIL